MTRTLEDNKNDMDEQLDYYVIFDLYSNIEVIGPFDSYDAMNVEVHRLDAKHEEKDIYTITKVSVTKGADIDAY